MLDNNQEFVNQPHYTIQEVSVLKKLSEDTIRRWARRQPDVLIYQDPKPGKRPYRTYRIPASALLRLYPNTSLPASPPPVVFNRKANKKRTRKRGVE
jgi:hypothetical protein